MNSRRLLSLLAVCGWLWWIPYAMAQEDPDLGALNLADQIAPVAATPSNWRNFAEVAAAGTQMRADRQGQTSERLSFDLNYDNSFASGWRVLFADRLDVNNPAQTPENHTVNTIREAYLSWQAQTGQLLDLGRINERNGVALGYNPTDYFKTAALRSIVSVDPNSLKINRQGSIMLRAQQLWDSGAATLLYSPKLDGSRDPGSFNPALASTNNEQRWLLKVSQQFSEGLTPQWLIFQSEQLPVQFGFNLTSLIDDASVVYLEWSGGRSPSLLTQALRQQGLPAGDDSEFRQRLATGLTYTTSNKISLSAEWNYNGAGMNSSQWDSFRQGPLPLYAVYRTRLQASQDAPTKQAAMLYLSWQDVGINHLDLTAMERLDLNDSSRLSWLEWRYHLSHSEFALQWQGNSGSRLTNYGAAPQVQSWAVVGRVYF